MKRKVERLTIPRANACAIAASDQTGNRKHKAKSRAHSVIEFSRQCLANGIGKQENRADLTELVIAEAQVVFNDFRQYRNSLSINVIDQGRQEDQSNDPPAEAR
jgi:hypothetical protein